MDLPSMERSSHKLPAERANRLRPALELLLEAHADAEALDRASLDCAPEVRDLYKSGLHTHDLRWLLLTRHVELAPPAMPAEAAPPSVIGDVPVTPAGVALARQICRSRKTKPRTDLARSAHRPGRRRPRPRWNAKSGDLWVGTILVKRLKQSASNLRTILEAFQEEHWRECIDDPLSPRHGVDSHQRLRDAIRRLNSFQIKPLLRFHRVNRGTAIRWESLA